MGSVAVVHGFIYSTTVGASQTRDPTRVSCIGRWILYHLAAGEALSFCKVTSKCTKEECSLLDPVVMKRDRPRMHTLSSATEWLNLDCFLGL